MDYLIILSILLIYGCSSPYVQTSDRSPAGVSSKNCNKLITSILQQEIPFSRSDIELTEKQVKSFSEKYQDYLNIKQIDPEGHVYMGQDSKVYTMGKELKVRFSGDRHNTVLHVFSNPVKRNGQSIVNIKLWSRDGKYFGLSNKVLENIPTARLWELVSESYPKLYVQKDQIILLPSNKKGNRGNSISEVWRVEKKMKDKVKVKSLEGQVRWVKYQEIFYSNIGIKNKEQELIELFFNNNGRGEVIRYIEPRPQYGGLTGVYIRINKLPQKKDFEKIKKLFVNDESYLALKKALDENIIIYLTNKNRGFGGFHANKRTSLSDFIKNRHQIGIWKNSITITTNSNSSVVKHELVHLKDDLRGVLKELKAWHKELKQHHKLSLKKKQLDKIYSFIKEQRAYSIEIKHLEKIKNKKGYITVQTYLGEQSYSYNEYAEMRIQNCISFFENYKNDMKVILDSLEASDYKEKLIRYLKNLTIHSDYIAIDDIF